MGSNGNKSEASELVARCQAVGWQVVKTTAGHWRVDTRKGAFTVASTPSDTRSVKNSLAEARRYGLETLEKRLKERLDRERQQKLEDDRKLNNAKLARIEAANGTGAVKPAVLIDTTVDLGLGFVNGVAIAAIAPAKFQSPRGSQLSVLANAEELLLVDDSVVYRCKIVIDGELCHRTFPSGNSVHVHITRHTRAQKAEEKVKEAIVENAPKVPAVVAAVTGTTDQVRAALTATLTEQVKAIDAIGASVIELRNITLGLVDQVKNVKTEVIVQEPDPELVAKARNWDALQTLRKQQEDLLGGKSA